MTFKRYFTNFFCREELFDIKPLATFPKATRTAPVSVAMSITISGLNFEAYVNAS